MPDSIREESTSKASFAAVGDIFLGDQPVCLGFGVRSLAQREGYSSFFSEIKDTLSRYELVVGNLETVIASRGSVTSPKSEALVDRADPGAAEAMRDAGINLVGLANNHIFEYGEPGLIHTINELDAADIEWVGKGNYRICDIGGNTVAFISWSLLPDTYWPSLDPSEYYNLASSITPILDEVASVKHLADYVVLLLHWGNESISRPSKTQQEIGRLLIDSGVDVLLGHHPHVLQPIEQYKGGIIAYSLGNFVMDSWEIAARASVVLEITFGESIEYRAIPVTIDKHTYQPMLARSQAERSRTLAALEYIEPLEDTEYLQAVHDERKRYRLSSLVHFAKNIHRVEFRNLIWIFSWGVRRVSFLASIAGKEKDDPNIVYRGPMH